MNNITEYSDQELSLMVFNDESLYNARHSIGFIESIINELFIYTDEQLEVLEEDLKEDLEEIS